jgi:hypothetical protein
MIARIITAIAASLSLSACATVMSGTDQSIAVATDPPGASCSIDRNGTHIGLVSPTPGSIHLDRSKDDLTFTCKDPGYQDAKLSQSPHFTGATFGNILIGGLVGVAVDAATGANFRYPDNVSIPLAPVAPAKANINIEGATEHEPL